MGQWAISHKASYLWFTFQDSDRKAELSGTVMMFKQYPRKASILNMSAVTTLYYCCFYHSSEGEVSDSQINLYCFNNTLETLDKKMLAADFGSFCI